MQHLIDHMKTAALAAGAYMKTTSDKAHTDKSNRKDFVTEADIRSQEIVIDELSKAFPGVLILSEEHSEEEQKKLYEKDFTGFVLDPIDGTFNFKRGMKESAISIGYIENGEMMAGVAFDPYRDELYWAEKGEGAFCNGEPIRVSDHDTIEGAAVAFSNSYDDETMKRMMLRHMAIYEQTGHMPWTSCPGSAVLLYSWIACGRVEAYHHTSLKPWDNAAAMLILREAGGEVRTLTGEQARFTDARVLAGNPKIVALLQDVFLKIDPKLLS